MCFNLRYTPILVEVTHFLQRTWLYYESEESTIRIMEENEIFFVKRNMTKAPMCMKNVSVGAPYYTLCEQL